MRTDETLFTVSKAQSLKVQEMIQGCGFQIEGFNKRRKWQDLLPRPLLTCCVFVQYNGVQCKSLVGK